jgi:hypothetical protein
MRYSSRVRAGTLYVQGYRFKSYYLNSIHGVMDNTSVYEADNQGSSPCESTIREVEEYGRPRSPWTREFAGSNPAFPT